jgi:hypothetical protein
MLFLENGPEEDPAEGLERVCASSCDSIDQVRLMTEQAEELRRPAKAP